MLITAVYLVVGILFFKRLFLSRNSYSILPSHLIFMVFYMSGLTNYLLCCVAGSLVGEYDTLFKRFSDVFFQNSLDVSLFEKVHLMYLFTVVALSYFVTSRKYNLKYTSLSVRVLPVFEARNSDLIVLIITALFLRALGLFVDSSLNFLLDASNLVLILFLMAWTVRNRSHQFLLIRIAISFVIILVFHTVLPYLQYYLSGYDLATIQRGSFARYLLVYFLYISSYMVLIRNVRIIKVTGLLLIVFLSSVLLDLAQDMFAANDYSLFDLVLRFMFGFEHAFFRNVAIIIDGLMNSRIEYYYGKTYLDAIYGLIPFTGQSRGLSSFIHLLYEDHMSAVLESRYASGLLTEGVLNYGVYIGPAVAALIVFGFSLLYDWLFIVSGKSMVYLLSSIYLNYMLYDLYRYDVAVLFRKLEYGIMVVLGSYLFILIVKAGLKNSKV